MTGIDRFAMQRSIDALEDVIAAAVLHSHEEHEACGDVCPHRRQEKEDAQRIARGVIEALADLGYTVTDPMP